MGVRSWSCLRCARGDEGGGRPNCVSCHTVGFGHERIPPEMGATKFVDAGRESCHGPGSARRTAPQPSSTRKELSHTGAGDCQKCHHGEFSRPFVWEKFCLSFSMGRRRRRGRKSVAEFYRAALQSWRSNAGCLRGAPPVGPLMTSGKFFVNAGCLGLRAVWGAGDLRGAGVVEAGQSEVGAADAVARWRADGAEP
jgi:hypothetical protein